MAKNAGRRANIEAQKTAKKQANEQAQLQKRAEKDNNKKEILYRVETKRDESVIKAYITFTYRVFHPGVTGRLIFIGILIAAPAIIVPQTWLKALCVIIGALLILLGLFRQYISLAITKSKDEAYQKGTLFRYDFSLSDAAFYADDQIFSTISKYKDITSFYYDDDFYYLGIRNKDFFIIPKSRFTIGDPAEFEDFIYKRSKKTCRWIPDKFSDRVKLRRAQRSLKEK